jgi:hypothetical protein
MLITVNTSKWQLCQVYKCFISFYSRNSSNYSFLNLKVEDLDEYDARKMKRQRNSNIIFNKYQKKSDSDIGKRK